MQHHVHPGHLVPPGGASQDLIRENTELRKKVKFLQVVGANFRQKIGWLFKEAAGKGGPGMKELDAAYQRLIGELPLGKDDSDTIMSISPRRPQSASPALEDLHLRASMEATPEGSEGQYWHAKFLQAAQKIRSLLANEKRLGDEEEAMVALADEERERGRRMHEEIESLRRQLAVSEERCAGLQKSLHSVMFPNTLSVTDASGDLDRHLKKIRDDERKEELLRAASPEVPNSAQLLLIKSMKEDNEQLSHQLSEALQRVRLVDQLQQENTSLQKHNGLLRGRIQRLKEVVKEMKTESSSGAVDMQNDIDVLLSSLNDSMVEIREKDEALAELQEDKAALIRDMHQMQSLIEKYKDRVARLEREVLARAKAEQVRVHERDHEVRALNSQVQEGESMIHDLSSQLAVLNDQITEQLKTLQENNFHMEALSVEKMSLQEKLQQLHMVLEERKQFAVLLGEVQDRLSTAVTELYQLQSTKSVADGIATLSEKVGGLEFLEQQLKIKDDMLAVRDDKIQQLQEGMRNFEESVDSISAIFLQFPRSVEQMEAAVIELDELRKAVHECEYMNKAEVEERIQIRKMEVAARRSTKSISAPTNPTGLAAVTMQVLKKAEYDSDDDDDMHSLGGSQAAAAAAACVAAAEKSGGIAGPLGEMYQKLIGPPPPAAARDSSPLVFIPTEVQKEAAFRAVDVEGRGLVEKKDVPILMGAVGMKVSEPAVASLIREIGKDPTTTSAINYDDFTRMCDKAAHFTAAQGDHPQRSATGGAVTPREAHLRLAHRPLPVSETSVNDVFDIFANKSGMVESRDMVTLIHTLGYVNIDHGEMASYLASKGTHRAFLTREEVMIAVKDICEHGMHKLGQGDEPEAAPHPAMISSSTHKLSPQPPSVSPARAPAPSPQISQSEMYHAFKAFETRDNPGFVDKDHIHTCLAALGLDMTRAVEEMLVLHDAFDFVMFQRAVQSCCGA